MTTLEILKIRQSMLNNDVTPTTINEKYAFATITENGTVKRWGTKGNIIEVKKVNSIEYYENEETFENKFENVMNKYFGK